MKNFWSVVSEKKIQELEKLHKITHNSIKNRGSTPILTNLVGVYPKNIHTKLEANQWRGSREEVERTKKSSRQWRRRTQGDC